MMRVGILHGGAPHGLEDKAVPPAQRLRVARHNELSSPYSSAAMSDGEGMLG
jgi:stearoyl-CoA desaturase (delta-9 desaturase)